jgi:hypothetical protein
MLAAPAVAASAKSANDRIRVAVIITPSLFTRRHHSLHAGADAGLWLGIALTHSLASHELQCFPNIVLARTGLPSDRFSIDKNHYFR